MRACVRACVCVCVCVCVFWRVPFRLVLISGKSTEQPFRGVPYGRNPTRSGDPGFETPSSTPTPLLAALVQRLLLQPELGGKNENPILARHRSWELVQADCGRAQSVHNDCPAPGDQLIPH